MTTPEERWEAFLGECVNVDGQHSGATQIDWDPLCRRETPHVHK